MTILYRGTPTGEILDADGRVIGKVVPVEPVAWASPNVIPLTGMRDNFPCILTPFKCEANTVPLLSAATLDLSGAVVRVPERAVSGPHASETTKMQNSWWNACLDALGVKS